MTTFTTPPASGQKFRGPVSTAIFGELQIFHKDRQTLSGTAASVSFTIPAGLRRLALSMKVRGDSAVNLQLVYLQINSDSTASYNYSYVQGQNTTVTASSTAADTKGIAGVITGTSAPANSFASNEVEFQSWDKTPFLPWTVHGAGFGTGVANFFSFNGGGQYTPAGPYTTLTLLPQAGNFISGSDFMVYGLIT